MEIHISDPILLASSAVINFLYNVTLFLSSIFLLLFSLILFLQKVSTVKRVCFLHPNVDKVLAQRSSWIC